jgi:thiol-disulfide isomerase/thioredoxin
VNVKSNYQNPATVVRLKTIYGKDTTLAGIAKSKATVLIFLSPECPLCKSYTLTLDSLNNKFKNSGISFCGVFPGKVYPIEEIRDFAKYFPVNFPLVLDTVYELTHLLNATVTPEAFVVANSGQTLYSGRIDNWAYEVSKKRQIITEHDLNDALNSIVNSIPIANTKTQAVGCFIELPQK